MNEPTSNRLWKAKRPCAKFGGGIIKKGDTVQAETPQQEEFYRARERDGDLVLVTHKAKNTKPENGAEDKPETPEEK